jgi:hypothetical protein
MGPLIRVVAATSEVDGVELPRSVGHAGGRRSQKPLPPALELYMVRQHLGWKTGRDWEKQLKLGPEETTRTTYVTIHRILLFPELRSITSIRTNHQSLDAWIAIYYFVLKNYIIPETVQLANEIVIDMFLQFTCHRFLLDLLMAKTCRGYW